MAMAADLSGLTQELLFRLYCVGSAGSQIVACSLGLGSHVNQR